MKNVQAISRRRFLGRAGFGGAGLLLLPCARSVWSAQANSKLNVALIGVGGRGEWFVETIPKLENVATQFETTLEFDPLAMKIVNNADADALLRCQYRQGWQL
jgi:hypothetical protein